MKPEDVRFIKESLSNNKEILKEIERKLELTREREVVYLRSWDKELLDWLADAFEESATKKENKGIKHLCERASTDLRDIVKYNPIYDIDENDDFLRKNKNENN